MNLTMAVKDKAYAEGFAAVGVLGRRRFAELPRGPVADVIELVAPEELLPTAKSLIILGFKVWDPAFNLVVTGLGASGETEFHQLYSETATALAWKVAAFLGSRGHEAVVARGLCLKRAAVMAGLGAQGRNTVLVSPVHGTSLRFAAVLTTAELDEDGTFDRDLCGDCRRCVDACPTKAISAGSIDLHRCLVYAAENPESTEVAEEVREAERRLIKRPTRASFIECTICLAACPLGAA